MYSSEDASVAEMIECRETFNQRLLEATVSSQVDAVTTRMRSNGGVPTEKDLEELKSISRSVEENEFESRTNDVVKFRIQLAGKLVSPEIRLVIEKRIEDASRRSSDREEYGKAIEWIEWMLKIPFEDVVPSPTPDRVEGILYSLAEDLDRNMFGMREIKERVLLTVHTRLRNPSARSVSLGLVGPPGVGKTMISQLVAKALGFPMQTISFGGIDRVEFLQGHESTYIGSYPGEFVRVLCKMGAKNGILLLDEYDNAANNPSVMSLMLHVTDPDHNHDNFRDHFFPGVPIDLSKLWFLYSMNKVPDHPAFRDRFVTVDVPAYSATEKTKMLHDFLLPSVLRDAKLQEDAVLVDEKAAKEIVRISSENVPGVRQLRFALVDIVQKLQFIVSNPSLSGKLNLRFSARERFSKCNANIVLTGSDCDSEEVKQNQQLSFPITLTVSMLPYILDEKSPDPNAHMYV